jgi:hypothetical protein
MLPDHVHWHFESSVSAATPLRVTRLDPGDQGAGITGMQAWGGVEGASRTLGRDA